MSSKKGSLYSEHTEKGIDRKLGNNAPTCVIFDMDDTIVSTSFLWRRAEIKFLQSYGHSWSEKLAKHYRGMSALDVANMMRSKLSIAESLEACQSKFKKYLFDSFREGPLVPMYGAENCLKFVQQHARLALASGSPIEIIEHVLKQFEWQQKFTVILTSEIVPKGKPAPDVFLRAANALSASIDECLVLEDSLPGVLAASAAGMQCFAVPSSETSAVQLRATRSFTSLDEITKGWFSFWQE